MAADREDLVSIPGDEEIETITEIYLSLRDLPDGTQRRILDWVSNRIAHDHDIARSLRDTALREKMTLNQHHSEQAVKAPLGNEPTDKEDP